MHLSNAPKLPISVSQLGLGTWAFGNDDYWGPQDYKDTLKTFHAALRFGIHHFDTAQVYGRGKAEQITGQQLRKIRDSVFIATKAMLHEPDIFRKKIEQSLKRLNCHYIDLFYIHWPKPGYKLQAFIKILEEYRQLGLIKNIGISNFTLSDLQQASSEGKIDYYQFGYNLLWRFPEEDVIPWCQKMKIKLVAYSSLAQGILSGRIQSKNDYPLSDYRRSLPFFSPRCWNKISSAIEELKILSLKIHLPLSNLVLMWTASRPFLDVTLFGARTRNQLEQNLKGVISPLESKELLPILNRMDEISSELMAVIPRHDNLFHHQPK